VCLVLANLVVSHLHHGLLVQTMLTVEYNISRVPGNCQRLFTGRIHWKECISVIAVNIPACQCQFESTDTKMSLQYKPLVQGFHGVWV
jgi:hypothetical protein